MTKAVKIRDRFIEQGTELFTYIDNFKVHTSTAVDKTINIGGLQRNAKKVRMQSKVDSIDSYFSRVIKTDLQNKRSEAKRLKKYAKRKY